MQEKLEKYINKSLIFFKRKKPWFLTLIIDNQTFAIFEEVVDNFGKSDDNMI